MRALAVLLLCSCAPVVTAIPSSLPHVYVDETIDGVRVSREAAVAILSMRENVRAEHDQKTIDFEAKIKLMQTQLDSETKRADTHAWWAVHGPGLFGGGVAVAIIIGAVCGVIFGGLLK